MRPIKPQASEEHGLTVAFRNEEVCVVIVVLLDFKRGTAQLWVLFLTGQWLELCEATPSERVCLYCWSLLHSFSYRTFWKAAGRLLGLGLSLKTQLRLHCHLFTFVPLQYRCCGTVLVTLLGVGCEHL